MNGTARGHTKSDASEAPRGVVTPTGAGGSGFLSDVIVELGFASRETVQHAVRAARSPGTTVARVLVDSGAITEEQLARATAERYGIDYVDLSGFEVDPAAAGLIKPAAARRYKAVPIAHAGTELLVATADPADALGLDDIAAMTKLEVRPAVAARPALEALVDALPLEVDAHSSELVVTRPRDEKAEREHERAEMTERELRDMLAAEEEGRRALESRLSEVEAAAFAAERAFEALRLAQGHMRAALRGLAGPDAAPPADAA